MIRRISCYVMAAIYFFAGLNHFMRPEMYKKMIPGYLQFHSLINYASGFAEIILGILVAIPATRRFACKAIMMLLILFIPVHINMIYTGWCPDGKCVPQWLLWSRLLVFQPFLIYWAWWNIQEKRKKNSI